MQLGFLKGIECNEQDVADVVEVQLVGAYHLGVLVVYLGLAGGVVGYILRKANGLATL